MSRGERTNKQCRILGKKTRQRQRQRNENKKTSKAPQTQTLIQPQQISEALN